MLELRPNCEYCDADLPPASQSARICSYECTFCAHCVDEVLHDVCPNCGGGFVPRPVRPAREYRDGVSLAHQPAAEQRVHIKYDTTSLPDFVAAIRHIPPVQR